MKPRISAALALFSMFSFGAHADSYNAATNQLTITSVQVGGTTYTNVVITVGGVVGVGGGRAIGSGSTYNAATNQLTIPSIQVGATTYTNVVVIPGRVVSAGSNSPAPAASANTTPTGGTGSGRTACNGDAAPAGVSYSQSGNTISVTTNGQCIPLPSAGLCAPSAPQATGINLLVKQNIKSFALKGIAFNMPGIPTNMFDSVAQGFVGSTCIKNAPTELGSLAINADVCYDVTQQIGPSLQSAASMITVTNPITMSMQLSATMATVGDCATSGADVISDAYTGKYSIKQATGGYLQIN